VIVLLDDDLFEYEQERPPRTKADLDGDVYYELSQDRRLAMVARRAADLFDHCSMYSTAALLRQLATAADFQVTAAAGFMEAD
jgi:hypothetical protein